VCGLIGPLMCNAYGARNHIVDAKARTNNTHREEGLLMQSFTVRTADPENGLSSCRRYIGSMAKITAAKPASRCTTPRCYSKAIRALHGQLVC
jgi:hypothetical protein